MGPSRQIHDLEARVSNFAASVRLRADSSTATVSVTAT
jgi:hypothetical protein